MRAFPYHVFLQDDCGANSSQPTFKVLTENVICGKSGVTCSRAIKISLGVSGWAPQGGRGLYFDHRFPGLAASTSIAQPVHHLSSFVSQEGVGGDW